MKPKPHVKPYMGCSCLPFREIFYVLLGCLQDPHVRISLQFSQNPKPIQTLEHLCGCISPAWAVRSAFHMSDLSCASSVSLWYPRSRCLLSAFLTTSTNHLYFMEVRAFCAIPILPLAQRTLVCSSCLISIYQCDGQILPPSGGGEILQTSKNKTPV